MKGYWRGTYSGTNSGQMIVEMDDRGDHFNGCAYAFDSNRALPSTFAVIRTIDKQPNTKLKCPLLPIDPRSGEPVDWQQLATLYAGQNVIVPKEAELEYAWTDQQLVIRWTTDIGTSGEATLAKSKARAPSERTPLPIATWRNSKPILSNLNLTDTYSVVKPDLGGFKHLFTVPAEETCDGFLEDIVSTPQASQCADKTRIRSI